MKKILAVFTACVILMTLLGGCAESVIPPAASESKAVTPSDDIDADEGVVTSQDVIEAETEQVIPPAAAESIVATPSDVIDAAEEIELTQAAKFGLPTEKIGQRTLSGREFMELADAFVAFAAPEKLNEWKNEFKVMREVDEPIYRYDAMVVMYQAGQLVGGGYAEGGDMDAWTAYYVNASYFDQTDQSTSHYQFLENYDEYIEMNIFGYHYSHVSKVSGRHPFYCNPDNCSFDLLDYPSYADGVLAILRLIGSVQPELFDPDLFPFDTPDPAIFDDELYEKMALYPELTVDTLPIWTGMIFTGTADYYTDSVELVRNAKEWGYNAVRIFLLPSAYDEKWEKLEDVRYMLVMDQMIAEAIKIGLHVELCCNMLPGRWFDVRGEQAGITGLMTYTMDLLYGDKYYQDLTDELWRTIAKRYKDVPNSCLSMLPMMIEVGYRDSWYEESTIHNEYTVQDVANYQAHLIDVIHEVDPKRILVFEPFAPTSPDYNAERFDLAAQQVVDAMVGKDNVAITYNVCDMAYCYHMLSNDMPDPDNYNHGAPLADYPTYLYEASNQISGEYPLKIDGLLPAGTEITLNLRSVVINAEGVNKTTLFIEADGNRLYEEEMSAEDFNVKRGISYLYPYAESDKQITVTLPTDTDVLTLGVFTDVDYPHYPDRTDPIYIEWSGIKAHLPEDYAVDQLWVASKLDYESGFSDVEGGVYIRHTSDVYISPRTSGLTEHNAINHDITIKDDLTYTTPSIRIETTPETIKSTFDLIENKSAAFTRTEVRSETPTGASSDWNATKRYTTDVYNEITSHGLSWWANDVFYLHNKGPMINIESTQWGRYEYFYSDVLELLQQYMAPGWCEFSAEVEGQGSVSGSQMIIAGNSATLTAVPDDGAEFFGWYLDGELISSELSYTAEVKADTRLVAKFTMPDGADNTEK